MSGRPLGTLNNPSVKGKLVTAMNPLCKLCLLSVMPGEMRVWLRRPMGISHATCADRADSTKIDRV